MLKGLSLAGVFVLLALTSAHAEEMKIGDIVIKQEDVIKVEHKQEKLEGKGDHEGHEQQNDNIWFRTGKVTYNLLYQRCIDAAHLQDDTVAGGKIGLNEPTEANWYWADFIRVLVDDVNVISRVASGTTDMEGKQTSPTTRKEAGKAAAEFVFEMPIEEQGTILKLSFLALNEGDALLCKGTVTSDKEAPSIKIVLNNFPSLMTEVHNKKGMRSIVTSGGAYKEKPVPPADGAQYHFTGNGPTYDLSPADEYWLLYSDEVFDPDTRPESMGPSALLFVPGEISKVQVKVTDYPVTTTLTCKPGTKTFHLVFWEFGKRGNKEVLEYLKANAEEVKKLVQAMEF